MHNQPTLSDANRALQRLIELENYSTPQEFVATADSILRSGQTELIAALERSRATAKLKKATALSALRCESESRFVRLYSTPGTTRRRLLIAFAGGRMRLMMPLPIFMQAMPEDTDLLVLYDPFLDHFRSGIWDGKYGIGDLSGITAPVRAAYRDVIALGTSGGGLPAIRFAKLARLRRAASFGGRQIDDTLAIIRKRIIPMAFDPLCACDTVVGTEALLIYSELHAIDAHAAACASVVKNSVMLPLRGRKDHGVLWRFEQMGHLDELLELLFSAKAESIRDHIDRWNASYPHEL
jgi:hypothetical protein